MLMDTLFIPVRIVTCVSNRDTLRKRGASIIPVPVHHVLYSVAKQSRDTLPETNFTYIATGIIRRHQERNTFIVRWKNVLVKPMERNTVSRGQGFTGQEFQTSTLRPPSSPTSRRSSEKVSCSHKNSCFRVKRIFVFPPHRPLMYRCKVSSYLPS